MAVFTIEIGGVERDVLLESLNLQRVANGVDTLAFDLESEDASYRAAIDDEVILKKDGTPIWGGVITVAPEEALGGPALPDIRTRVTASSFDILATYRIITITIPAGTTLAGALALLQPYLSTHGVTVHPSQATGPALPELTFTRQRIDKILDQLSLLTQYDYLHEITVEKYLHLYVPTAAPFDVLDTGAVHQVGDVRVERTVNELYANRAIVTVTGAGPATSQESFTAADGVSSGGSPDEVIRFTAKFPASSNINDLYPNQLKFDGVVVGIIGFGPTQLGPADWYWDYTVSPAQLVYPVAGGRAFPTGAQVIDIEYAIAYPFDVTANNLAEQALRGIIDREFALPDAMGLLAAQAFADAIVATSARVVTKVQYTTWDDGLRPGMLQAITQAKRAVDATCLILDVKTSYEPDSDGSFLRHDVTAVEGSNIESDWRKVYKDWLGGRSGSGSAGGGVATTGSVRPPASILIAKLSLSDAQLKAATDTPVVVVGAPGVGLRIKVLAASMRFDTSGGIYTNIDPDSAGIDLVCGSARMSCGWYNDSAVPTSKFDDLFGVAQEKIVDFPVPAMDAIPSAGGSPAATELYVMGEDPPSTPDATAVENAALYMHLFNNGAGDLTGGAGTNGLKLTVYYLLEDVVPDWPMVIPTRLYLSNAAAGFTPTNYRGAWDDTPDAITKALVITKSESGAVIYVSANHDTAAANRDLLAYRGVSAPLAAQTIAGNIYAVLSAFGGAFVDHGMKHHVHIYVTVGDSDTVRGTLLSDFCDITAWSGIQGQEVPTQTLSSLAVSAGDRIVCEFGARTSQMSVPAFEYYAQIGYKATADKPDATHHDGAGLGESVSWIDFLNGLTFQ